MKPNVFFLRSLKTRVTLFTLIIFMVSIWSLMFYASRMLRDDMQRMLGEQQFSTVTLLATEINQKLSNRLFALETIAKMISPELLANPSALQKRMESYPIFQSLFNEGTFVTQVKGIAIADVGSSKSRLGVDYSDTNNTPFMTTLREGKSSISSPLVGRVLKAPLFAMAAPIKDAHGNFIGALMGVIDLNKSNFLDSITESHYGKTGGYLIVDRTSRCIVTATDKNRIMEHAPPVGENPAIDKFFENYEGTAVFVDTFGIEVMESVKSIPTANWHITAILPTAEAFEPLRLMQNKMLLAAMILTLWATGLTWWILKRQLSPMLRTIQLLTCLTNSDETPSSLPVQNQNEIGDLIRSFNRLLEKIAQREQALKTSEERFELAIDGAEAGVWDNDLVTGEIYHSPQMSGMLGYTQDELPPNFNAWQVITHPEDWDSTWLKFNKHLENPIHEYNVVIRFRHKNGKWRWIHARGKATRDSSGFPLRMTGTHIDITERMQLEIELSEVHAKTLMLIDAIPDLIFYKDVNGVYLGCNEAFSELVGRPVQKIIGKTDYDLFSKEIADFFREYDQATLSLEQRQSNEEWVDYPDGRHVLLHTIKTPFWSKEEHNLQGILGISRNITERYEAEKTVRLAKNLAEEATKTKSNFLANMSHEIRTPMNAIIGLSYLALQTDLSPQQNDYLTKIQHSSHHLLGIINDVLDFSKIEAGKLLIEQNDFEFANLLENLTNLTADKARDKGLKLFFDVDSRVPKSLNGDALRLGQILINYVNNAIKFTDQGGVSMNVNVIDESAHDVVLKFAVRDTGIGLTSDVKEQLFQSFQQADASTSRKYGGTGLGLAISKQLATLMNGTVGVESELGKGSTFWFTAKLSKVNGLVKMANPDVTNFKEALKIIQGATLLIVEDNEFNQDVMMGLLANCAFDIQLANNGKEAVEMVRQHNYDVVFMDMQMPIMDGVSATIEIRKNPDFDELPIIAMTANALSQDKEKCFVAGMNDYLVKPIYPDDLYRTLLKWVKPTCTSD